MSFFPSDLSSISINVNFLLLTLLRAFIEISLLSVGLIGDILVGTLWYSFLGLCSLSFLLGDVVSGCL